MLKLGPFKEIFQFQLKWPFHIILKWERENTCYSFSTHLGDYLEGSLFRRCFLCGCYATTRRPETSTQRCAKNSTLVLRQEQNFDISFLVQISTASKNIAWWEVKRVHFLRKYKHKKYFTVYSWVYLVLNRCVKNWQICQSVKKTRKKNSRNGTWNKHDLFDEFFSWLWEINSIITFNNLTPTKYQGLKGSTLTLLLGI